MVSPLSTLCQYITQCEDSSAPYDADCVLIVWSEPVPAVALASIKEGKEDWKCLTPILKDVQ